MQQEDLKDMNKDADKKKAPLTSAKFSLTDLAFDFSDNYNVSHFDVEKQVFGFLKDKFNIVGDGAVELVAKLPKAVVEKIENFDGEGISSIAKSISDTILSIELPDIEFSDIDF